MPLSVCCQRKQGHPEVSLPSERPPWDLVVPGGRVSWAERTQHQVDRKVSGQGLEENVGVNHSGGFFKCDQTWGHM